MAPFLGDVLFLQNEARRLSIKTSLLLVFLLLGLSCGFLFSWPIAATKGRSSRRRLGSSEGNQQLSSPKQAELSPWVFGSAYFPDHLGGFRGQPYNELSPNSPVFCLVWRPKNSASWKGRTFCPKASEVNPMAVTLIESSEL